MKETIALRKNPDIVARLIDNETILVPIYRTSDEINCIYTLNKVASWVWGAIDGKKTLGKIKKQILEKFDTAPKEVNRKTEKLLKDLKKIKAIK